MIKVYSRTSCIQCKMTKRYLVQANVAFKDIDLDNPKNDSARKFLQSQGFKTTPVLISDSQTIVGFAPSKLAKLIKELDGQRQPQILHFQEGRHVQVVFGVLSKKLGGNQNEGF